MNTAQAKVKGKKMSERALKVREELWPGLDPQALWDRTSAAGFTTMPRTLVYVMNIIDSLTKGKPASMVYLTLWCRLFESGIVELASEKTMAFEAGFTGERAVDTWRRRMRQLRELGFIDYKPGKDHEFQWALVYNPHHAVLRLDSKVQGRHRVALLDRGSEVGAKDLALPPPTPPSTEAAPASSVFDI